MRELIRPCVGDGGIREGRSRRAGASYWKDEGTVMCPGVISLFLPGHMAKALAASFPIGNYVNRPPRMSVDPGPSFWKLFPETKILQAPVRIRPFLIRNDILDGPGNSTRLWLPWNY